MAPKVGIVGLSHLGLVTGIAIAAKGCQLVGFDSNKDLIEQLKLNRLPVYEVGLQELLDESSRRISFTSDSNELRSCDIVYFARDVPTNSDNVSELTPLLELLESVISDIKADASVVIHSQVSPGFTRDLLPRFKKHSPKINLYYQVETLIFGNAVQRVMYPERYIIGCEDPSTQFESSYLTLLNMFGCPLLPMRYESAELAKIAINMFLVSSVMTTSTLAELCENIGADWREIAPSLRLDRRIGPHAYLEPGLGIAGGNLERDLMTVTALARQHGTDCDVVDAWRAHGSYRRDWAFRKLYDLVLSKNKDALIAVWGLAYKAGTHSIKNSPALLLLERISSFKSRVYDPKVKLDKSIYFNSEQLETALEACRDADVLVVMTPWEEFKTIAPHQVSEKLRGKVIIDPFRALKTEDFSAHFDLHTLGFTN